MTRFLFIFGFMILCQGIFSQQLKNAEGKLIGQIKADGTVLDEKNKLAGKIKNDGSVSNARSEVIGYLKADGSVENESHKVLGYITYDGTVQDESHKTIGYVEDSGLVVDKDQETIGYAKDVPPKWAAIYFFSCSKPFEFSNQLVTSGVGLQTKRYFMIDPISSKELM